MNSSEPSSGVFRATDFELVVVVSDAKSRGLAGDILIHVHSMQYDGVSFRHQKFVVISALLLMGAMGVSMLGTDCLLVTNLGTQMTDVLFSLQLPTKAFH